MKNNRNTLKRIFAFIIAIAALSCILSLTAFASGGTTATGNPGIVLQNYDANAIVRVIVNTLVGVLVLAGVVYGGFQIIMGFNSDDPKEKRTGIIAVLASLSVGGLIIAVVNMIIA